MSNIRIRPGSLDQIDSTHLEEMVRSPGYASFRIRQLSQRAQCVDQLIAATLWENVRFLQGQICAIDRTLELPKIIRAEIDQRSARLHKGEK